MNPSVDYIPFYMYLATFTFFSVPCKDKNSGDCQFSIFLDRDWCAKNAAEALEDCPLTCDLCKEASEGNRFLLMFSYCDCSLPGKC